MESGARVAQPEEVPAVVCNQKLQAPRHEFIRVAKSPNRSLFGA